MIVVSDTSPLNYLLLIHEINVLPRLFGAVHVPVEVMRELQRLQAPPAVRQWAAAPPSWLHVRAPSSAFVLPLRLDPGETEALAKELGADAVLMDERKGRRAAREMGLHVLGTLTVLELAHEAELLDLPVAIAALRQTTFHLSDSLAQTVLARVRPRRKET